MAKRKRNININKRLKEGRGSGRGAEYKPWITIQDVPSLGRATRLRGIKTNRQHELLSDLERNYFYFLDFSDIVEDIREQYPLLPIEETILIANELGVEHPKHPKTGEYVVMTTDFLIDIKNKSCEIARTIKPKNDLMNKRVLEKFEIERRYWEKKDINWGIVTEEEIDRDIAQNISFIHGNKNIENIDSLKDISGNELKDLLHEFIKRSIDDKKTMRNICSDFDNEMCLKKGTGISIFKYLIINKIIEIDITEKIDLNHRIHIVINNELIRKVEAV